MEEDFGIDFNVRGNAVKALQSIQKELTAVTKQAKNLERNLGGGKSGGGLVGDNKKQIKDAGDGIKGFVNDLNLSIMGMAQFGSIIDSTFNSITSRVKSVAMTGFNTAAGIEESNARLKFGLQKLGLEYESIEKKIDAVSLKTVLTRRELADLTTGLGIQGINIWSENMENLTIKTKEGTEAIVSATEVMADAAAFSGRGSSRIIFGVKEAAAEGLRRGWLSEDLDLSIKMRKEWNKQLDKGKNKQERFEILMGLMADKVGGMALALGNTFNFMMQQVDDWTDKVYNELFKGALPIIRELVKDTGEYIIKLTSNDNLKGVRDAITDITKMLAQVARYVGRVLQAIIEFTVAHPRVVKIAFWLGVALTTMLALLSAAVTFGIVVQGIVAGLMGWYKMVELTRIAMSSVSSFMTKMGGARGVITMLKGQFAKLAASMGPVLLYAGLIAVALAFLARMLVGGKSWIDTWNRLKLVFAAISEGLQNMKDGMTHISTKSAVALKKAGLFNFVYSFLRGAARMKRFWMGFMESWHDAWPRIRDQAWMTLRAILGILDNIGRAFGVFGPEGSLKNLMMLSDTDIDSWEKAGAVIGQTIARLVDQAFMFSLQFYEAAEYISGILADLEQIYSFGRLALNPYGYLRDMMHDEQGGGPTIAEQVQAGDVRGAYGTFTQSFRAKAEQWWNGDGPTPEEYEPTMVGPRAPAGDWHPSMTAGQAAGAARSLNREDMSPKTMAEYIGRSVQNAIATAHRDHPARVNIDGDELLNKLAEGARAQQEEGR